MTRPRIGLALGSGAGRGWAHIGILKALGEAGIEPDIVCGTSVGALVGGVYLSGHLPVLETWARGLTKMRILRLLDFRMGGGGFVSGDRLSGLLRRNLGDTMIEDLPKPFAAVATNLATGHEIWFRKGPAVQAIRASYALPGVFNPVKVDGQWLVDGALVNPLPVSVCRAMGAQLVIAANLNGDIIGKHWKNRERPVRGEAGLDLKEIEENNAGSEGGIFSSMLQSVFGTEKRGEHGIFSVMMASLNIIQDRLSRSRMAGDPPDVQITPRIGHIGLLEFDRADECMDEGAAAVELALPALRDALAVLELP
jgi:NTE family protein